MILHKEHHSSMYATTFCKRCCILSKQKKTNNFQRVLAGTPPPPLPKSLETLFVFCFSKVFSKVFTSFERVLAGTPPKCLWECSKTSVKTSQNIILNHGKTALPGAAVLLFIYMCVCYILFRYHANHYTSHMLFIYIYIYVCRTLYIHISLHTYVCTFLEQPSPSRLSPWLAWTQAGN